MPQAKKVTDYFKLGEDKFFFKILEKKNFIRERNGYEEIFKHYPVPRLIYTSPLVKRDGVLVFEYENSVGKNKGLLVDDFAHKKTLDKNFTDILNLYRKVFLETLKKDRGDASNIFFKDRVNERLPKYYKRSFINKNIDIDLNGNKISGNLNKILEDINKFFNTEDKKWCVISQCDPNDLNIATKPLIFDYTAGGLVPLMAEFATFFWYQLAQGSYLSLKYNPNAFVDHRDIYKKIDRVSLKGNKVRHATSKMRTEFIEEYIERVVEPCLKRMPSKDATIWYKQFKNYLAMKIIGVFDISKMSKKDQLLSLGYLHLFYNSDIIDFKSLINLIKHKS